jgi:hypothetical protein
MTSAPLFGRQERRIFLNEIRSCFSLQRVPVFTLLGILGVLLSVTRSEIPPLIRIVLIALVGMEKQFNNMLFVAPHEFEALTLLPVAWHRIVLAKNVATLCSTAILAGLLAMPMLYFSPVPFHPADAMDAAQFGLALAFPLLLTGNIASVQSPRKGRETMSDPFVSLVGMLLFVVVFALPVSLLTTYVQTSLVTLPYIGGTGVYWYKVSVPRTALRISQKRFQLCTL